MARSSLLFIAALTSVSVTTTSAQFFSNNTLGSCVDVDCPPVSENDSTTMAACRVTNRTYGMIGLDTFSSSIADEGNLTWTVGTHVYDDADPNNSTTRIIEKGFYLGTPASLALSDEDEEQSYLGCAIFIHGNNMTKPARNESWECADVVGAECMASLLKDATAHLLMSGQNGTEGAEEACQRVQNGLRSNFADGCGKLVEAGDQPSWDEVHAVPLTGPNAPQPPSPSANESSTCHPTLPKSNDLRFVYGYNDTGTVYYESTYPMFFAVNLVLTLFWAPGGNGTTGGELQVPDSHLSCLWPVDLNNEQAEGLQPGGGVRLGGSMVFAGVVAVVTSLVLLA